MTNNKQKKIRLCICLVFLIILTSIVYADLDISKVNYIPEIPKAGRALITTVTIENYDNMNTNSVKVSIAIPELGISASDYISLIESEEGEEEIVVWKETKDGTVIDERSLGTSEEIYIRIPPNTKAGTYEMIASAESGDNYAEESISVDIINDNPEIESEDENPPLTCDFCPKACERGDPNETTCGDCICPENLGFCDTVGTREVINETPAYCYQGLWMTQKEETEQCQNNFECITNFCSDSVCYDISKEVEDTKNLVKRILDWLSSLFGFGEA